MAKIEVVFEEKKAEQAVLLPQGDLIRGIAGSALVLQIGTVQYSVSIGSIIEALASKQLATFEQEVEPLK